MNISNDYRFTLRYESVLSFLLGFGAFLSLSPFFLWGTGLYKFFAVPVFVMSIAYYAWVNNIAFNNFCLAFLFIFLVLIFNFSSNGFVLYFNSSFILIVAFLLMSDEGKYRIYVIFYRLFALSLIPGIFIFILNSLGFYLPWEPLQPISETRHEAGVYYRNYGGSLALSTEIYSTGIGEVYRFTSIYDEPGVVGTVAALLLLANRFNLSSVSSKVILISGVISFSLAFYILVFVYLLIRNPLFLIKLLVPFFVMLLVFFNELNNIELIDKFFFNRIKNLLVDPESVDNRVDLCFANEFSSFVQTDSLIIGNGAWAHTFLGCDVSSYLIIFYNHGFLGFGLIVLFYLFYLLILIGKLNFKVFLYLTPFILTFVLALYQRPDFFAMWIIVIFSAAILSEARRPLHHPISRRACS